MNVRRHLKNRKHLIRMIVVCVGFLLLPFVGFSQFVMNYSYRRMLAANEEYFLETTKNFAVFCNKEIYDMTVLAAQISEDSRNSKREASAIQLGLMKQNAYYYFECIGALNAYDVNNPYKIGLYFKDGDLLFINGTKLTAAEYAARAFPTGDETGRASLAAFFQTDHMTGEPLPFYSAYAAGRAGGFLIVGVPSNVGYNKDRALVFFVLESGAVEPVNFSSESATGAFFYVADDDKLLYASAAPEKWYAAGPPSLGWPGHAIDYHTDAYGVRYTVFSYRGYAFRFNYQTIVPFDAVATNVYDFYNTIRIILVLSLVIFIVSAFFLVYVSYSPVAKLTRRVGADGSEGEFIAINRRIDQMENEQSEQNMLILDLLIGNMLYGFPIPENEIHRLNVGPHTEFYCVLTAFGVKLKTGERTGIAAGMRDDMDVTAFITDILYKDHTVFICLLPDDNAASPGAYIKNRLSETYGDAFEIKTGTVVKRIGDIKLSYESTLAGETRANGAERSGARRRAPDNVKQKNKFKDNVLDYVSHNAFNPNISQINVADHFGVSIYSLSRLFSKEAGIGFSEFITQKRIEKAKTELAETDKTIGQIANEIGIPNVSYFTRLFKETTGELPRAYRAAQKIKP